MTDGRTGQITDRSIDRYIINLKNHINYFLGFCYTGQVDQKLMLYLTNFGLFGCVVACKDD